jgi:hypothetical protein
MPGPQINTLPRIDSVHMAVSVDDDGSEGICAVDINGTMMPLIAADEARLSFIRDWAFAVAFRDRRIVRIVRLTRREEIEVFDLRDAPS